MRQTLHKWPCNYPHQKRRQKLAPKCAHRDARQRAPSTENLQTWMAFDSHATISSRWKTRDATSVGTPPPRNLLKFAFLSTFLGELQREGHKTPTSSKFALPQKVHRKSTWYRSWRIGVRCWRLDMCLLPSLVYSLLLEKFSAIEIPLQECYCRGSHEVRDPKGNQQR